MSAFGCPKCGRTFPESGFCPFDGAALTGKKTMAGVVRPTGSSNAAAATPAQPQISTAFAGSPTSTDSGTLPGLPRTGTGDDGLRTMVSNGPPVHKGTDTPQTGGPGVFRAMSAAENTADALAAFHAGASAVTEYDRLIGQTLDGRYHIERKLGEGGMGVVFAARHAVIERPLAIKVLKREVMRDTATIKRFVQEAKAASRIGHPNIVDVTDFGTTPDGMTYQVMEYVDGVTLGSAIKSGSPFKVSRAMRIAAQIARALGSAHDKGIVHRDLKPENIFLVNRDGRQDFVKIVDFGIAKVAPVEGAPTDGPRLTRAGAVFGTPEYMAPEQAAGRGDTDGRVDIYALGIILYEMCTGKVPHKGDTMVRTLAMQMLDPAKPMAEVRPELSIPPEFDRIVMRSLAKKRDQRYQTMGELVNDLEAFAGATLNEPISSSITGSPSFTLSPLPPGADSRALMSQRPSIPVLERNTRGDSMADSVPISQRDSAQMAAQNPLSITGDGNPRLSRRIRNEPEFVISGGPKPVAMMDHLEADELQPQPRARWPWLMVAGGLAAILGVAIAVTLRKPKTTSTVIAVTEQPVDAHEFIPMDAGLPPAPTDAMIVEIPIDAGRNPHHVIVNNTPHTDAGMIVAQRRDGGVPIALPTGNDRPGITPRGTVAIQFVTRPPGGTLYIEDNYGGLDGVTIEEPWGSSHLIKCTLPGYDSGIVTAQFDGRAEVLLCRMEIANKCVPGLHNPYANCPE